MSSWSELLDTYRKQVSQQQAPSGPSWLDKELYAQLSKISKLRDGSTVIFYASAFLQKKTQHMLTSIDREDMNGFMNALYKPKNDNRLTLILHTSGGDPNAVESIVDYLHAKFKHIEVIVPYLAMSGGAMISLASDLLILGKPSQLGPIDPQLNIRGKTHSARAIQEGFERAKRDISKDVKLAHLWAPVLQSMGPSLVVEAEKALSYSKDLVVRWLNQRMFSDSSNENERKSKANSKNPVLRWLKQRMFSDSSNENKRESKANAIAAYFNAEDIKDRERIHVHGQRIGVEKLEQLGVEVELLEKNQELQNAVLTAYHLMTLIFETSSSLKFIASDRKQMWVKHQPPQPQVIMSPQQQPIPQQPAPQQPKVPRRS